MMSNNQLIKSNPFNRHAPDDIFNELNILYRVCVKFTPKSADENNICGCNRPRESEQHTQEPDAKGTKWNMLDNTQEVINPAQGKLPNGALYAQFALDTPEPKVEKILLNVWKIPPPRLIMSIAGGAKYFVLSDRLETNFINGIINVALKSDAWIITNGYNVGIVQLVGQAIKKVKLTNPKEKITAIGLCKWGSIKNVERLTNHQHMKTQKMTNRSSMMENDGKTNERAHGERDLEMNHSHYLMADDGTFRDYNIRDYRTKLVVHLAKLQHENEFPIPAVTIVVEGGRDTVSTMYNDLRANIPVVIIDGSGRVADFFKRWLLYTKEFDDPSKDSEFPYEIGEINKVTPVTTLPPITTDQNAGSRSSGLTFVQLQLDKSRNVLQEKFAKYKDQLRKELDSIISHDDDPNKRKRKKEGSEHARSDKITGALNQVMYCLQPAVRSGITVFNLESDTNLSETIFRSICKSRQKYFERRENDQNDTIEMSQRKIKSSSSSSVHMKERQKNARQDVNKKDKNAQRSQLLQLAMDWNCIDVAKTFILQNSLDNILNKEQAFLYALTNDLDLSTFVYEFLKLGIDPSDIFFPNDEFFHGRSRYRKLLRGLYESKYVNSDKTHLSLFIESDTDVPEKKIETTDDLNEVLSSLIGDYMHDLYFNSQEDENQYKVLWSLEEKYIPEQNQIDVHVMDAHEYLLHNENKRTIHDCTMRDLFLWSILMNRIEMAKVFLSHMKYRICAALIATKILKEYYDKAPYGTLKDGYMEDANYFQKYAIECINQCEENDSSQACQIVLQQIQLYGYITCLQVASHAADKLFIATPCCVQAMNNIWYNKIHPEQSRKRNEVSMTLGVFSFGLLAPFFVTYRQATEESKDERPTESLQPYGINYSDPYPLAHPRIIKNPSINNYFHRLKNFHNVPRMKYCYHCITYCFFLLLFSYVLLFDFDPPTNNIPSIGWTEILTIIMVSLMLIEEIIYFASLSSLTLTGKFIGYFRNLLKIMTLIGFILFYIGLILRFTYANTSDQFVAARVVMAIDLELWWLRSLAFIIVVPFLGPHLVAIATMLKDLLFFMCIIAIAMIAYGVASRSMVYYHNPDDFNGTTIDTSFDGRSIFRQIIYPVYYLLYSQFGNELSNLDEYPNAAWSIATHVLLAIHMIFVNILLTNLLIAMFSKRFDQVYDDTKNIWHSQQYLFTREYYTRSSFFPPISSFYDIYRLCRITYFAIRQVFFKKPADRRAKVFKMIPINKDVIKDLYEFEGASTYEYAHAEVKAAKMAATTSTTTGSDSSNNEKREDTNDNTNDSNNSVSDIRQVQNDLAKLNQSLGEMREDLRRFIDAQTTIK